jgi:hypothetical protein
VFLSARDAFSVSRMRSGATDDSKQPTVSGCSVGCGNYRIALRHQLSRRGPLRRRADGDTRSGLASARTLLGHSDPAVAEAHYNHASPEGAATEVQDHFIDEAKCVHARSAWARRIRPPGQESRRTTSEFNLHCDGPAANCIRAAFWAPQQRGGRSAQ